MILKEENSDFVYLGKRIDKTLNYIQNNKTDLLDWFKQYVESPYLNMISGELEIEEEDYIFDYLDSLVDDLEIKYNTILENKKIMTNETLRMQFLSGVITESEYKAIINKEIEDAEKASLNESMIGGIVGIGAINQIPPRAKADYETAFEHFLGGKYGLNEEMEVMVDSNMLKSYFNELISLADDMEYTPEMVNELKNLKNTLQGGKISVKNALDLIQKTIDITEDDIDAVEALSQAVDNDDAIIDKAREIYSLDESKEVEEDFKFGGKNGLTMAGDEPTPVKVNKVKQELSGIASIMEDAFQAFNKEVQQKYPDIFQDKNLLSRIEMMAQQIKRLKNEVKGLNEVRVYENMLSVNDSVRITAPLDISAETDEGMITKVYPNFNSIPSEDIGYYEVDADAYDESALNGPWYKVDLDGEEELYPAEELELN